MLELTYSYYHKQYYSKSSLSKLLESISLNVVLGNIFKFEILLIKLLTEIH